MGWGNHHDDHPTASELERRLEQGDRVSSLEASLRQMAGENDRLSRRNEFLESALSRLGEGKLKMDKDQAARWHQAAKIIEADGVGGYWSCRSRFGQQVADALIVAFLRRQLNPAEQFPAPDDLADRVNAILRREGLLE